MFSGTSGQFLGDRLPRAVRERPVVFVLGPPGVGKTVVSRRFLGEDARLLDNRQLQQAIAHQVRHRSWQPGLQSARGLIIDEPCYIDSRPGFAKQVGRLLRDRIAANGRTWITESAEGGPLQALIAAVSPELRATIALRFPVGRGRRRFVLRLCDELGVGRERIDDALALDPWSYAAARAALTAVSRDLSEQG